MSDPLWTEHPLSDLDSFDTVFLDAVNDAPYLGFIDQTALPNRLVIKRVRSVEAVVDAIKRLEVRGAPAIGVGAALGVYACAWHRDREEAPKLEGFLAQVEELCDRIGGARPTAVNLSWAVARMRRRLREEAARPKVSPGSVLAGLRGEALAIRDEDVEACRAIGEHGAALLRGGDGVLTHCNAGRLCAVRYGTATAPVYVARERGLELHVYCDETRPLLQGARLTALELVEAGVDTTLICDNTSASTMRAGLVQAVFVGCDRVAANGDTANKIGTSMVALAAKRYGVPFYVCAPTSTIDLTLANGARIPIEERAAAEVTELWYSEPMAPAGVKVRNPAFDVTDADLITAFVTEKGIVRPPFERGLAEVCAQ